MHHPTDRITHTTVFVTPVVEHWLEREIAQWDVMIKTQNYMINYGLCYTSRGALAGRRNNSMCPLVVVVMVVIVMCSYK